MVRFGLSEGRFSFVGSFTEMCISIRIHGAVSLPINKKFAADVVG